MSRTETIRVVCWGRIGDQVVLNERGGERRGFACPQCDFDRMDFWPKEGTAFDLTLSWSRVTGYSNTGVAEFDVWEPIAIGNVIFY